MNREEKKAWVKSRWSISSGDRIAFMLKRYFSSVDIDAPSEKEIESIFETKLL